MHVLIICSLLLSLSCKKKATQVIFSGRVLNGATSVPISGAKVTIASTSVQSWVYNANFQDIESVETDAQGTFSFNIDRAAASAYRLYVFKNNYFESIIVINADEVSDVDIHDETIDLFSEAQINIKVHNQTPFDAEDKITYKILEGAYSCSNCCPTSYLHGFGENYDTTFTCKTYGSLNFVVESMITKDNSTVQRFDSVFVLPFQENDLDIYY